MPNPLMMKRILPKDVKEGTVVVQRHPLIGYFPVLLVNSTPMRAFSLLEQSLEMSYIVLLLPTPGLKEVQWPWKESKPNSGTGLVK